jgi:hypothetical protein
LVVLFTVLAGCSGGPGEATPERYRLIELNMSLSQVEDLMGGYGEIQTFEGQPAEETTYRWDAPDSDYHIYATFKDGRVGSLVEYH